MSVHYGAMLEKSDFSRNMVSVFVVISSISIFLILTKYILAGHDFYIKFFYFFLISIIGVPLLAGYTVIIMIIVAWISDKKGILHWILCIPIAIFLKILILIPIWIILSRYHFGQYMIMFIDPLIMASMLYTVIKKFKITVLFIYLAILIMNTYLVYIKSVDYIDSIDWIKFEHFAIQPIVIILFIVFAIYSNRQSQDAKIQY